MLTWGGLKGGISIALAMSLPEFEGRDAVLGAREREVLQLIAEGWSTKQIASHLYVSIKTIETHRANLMRKLDAGSVADLVRVAIVSGMVEGGKVEPGI